MIHKVEILFILCHSNNVQMIAGPADDNGEHAERDGICENPDRRSGHGRDGGGSMKQQSLLWKFSTPNILGTNGI